MKAETLRRAWEKARSEIFVAEVEGTYWLTRRDKRRRQEAAFFRGMVRVLGSQRKAAKFVGINHSVISRTLDPEGHAKNRAAGKRRDSVVRNRNLTTPTEPPADNVVSFERPVKLSELYDPKVTYWDHPNIRTIELALDRCTRPELAYVIDRIIPVFENTLKRRVHHERTTEARTSTQDKASHVR